MKVLTHSFAGDKLKGDLLKQIHQGILKPEQLILPEEKLAKMYKISYMTVRKITDELVANRLLHRIQGKGTFVQSIKQRESQSYNKSVMLFLNRGFSSVKGGLSFYGDLLQHLYAYLDKENFNIKHRFLENKKSSKLRLNSHDMKDMLGAIFVGEYFGNKKILFRNVPTVFIDHDMSDKKVTSIVSKNLSGGEEATRYLRGIGLKKIGFVGDNQSNYKLRYKGYCEALNSAKIPINKKIIWFDFDKVSKDLQRDSSIVDALFCCADCITMRIVNFLYKNGINIPEDVSIISYDDTDMLTYIEPPITCISVDRAEMAKLAVSALKKNIKTGRNTGQLIEVSTKLVIRDSCKNTGV